MFKRSENRRFPPVPQKDQYTRYYEHDGQLRAYANRSMLMAGALRCNRFGFAWLCDLRLCSRRRSFASQMARRLRSAEGRPARLRRSREPVY